MQRRLSCIGRPEEGNLRRALGLKHERWRTAGAALLWPLEFFGELFDATLDVALEMISPLVLRNDAKHLPQMLKAFSRVARLAKRSLCGLVIGREVSRHDSLGAEASAPYATLVRPAPAKYFTSPAPLSSGT